MKKVFSLSIGMIFAAVVLCFSITPLLSAAMAGDAGSHCGSTHQQSKDSTPKSCQHDVKTQAQFFQQANSIQIIELSHSIFLADFFYSRIVRGFQNPTSPVFAQGPPVSQGCQILMSLKTVVLRF